MIGAGISNSASAPYVAVDGFRSSINFDLYADYEWFIELTVKVTTGTGSFRLYNDTDASILTESVVTTTSATYATIRSSAITKLVGTKAIQLQFGQTGGGTVYVSSARHIFVKPL
jgi:hypothetical protein